MFDPNALIVFIGAVFVLAFIPGPDNLFVSAQSLSHGARAGLAAAAGIIVGGVMWTLAAALGLTAILATSTMLLVLIQVLGAGYLFYLAVQLWRAHPNNTAPAPKLSHAFRRGLTTNLLNPKVGLYYLAFLPQFVDIERASIWSQMLVLGLIFNAIGVVVMGTIALAAGRMHQTMQTRPNAGKYLARVGALILVGIAAQLIWGLLP